MILRYNTVFAVIALLLVLQQSAFAGDLVPFPTQPEGVPFPSEIWPEFDRGHSLRRRVESVIGAAFHGERPAALARTRAVVVVSGGRILAERYADDIQPHTRLQSWSMAKSFLHAALGVAVADGFINPDLPAKVPEWEAPGDPRHAITIRELAQMTDGLVFDEDYSNPGSAAMQMLFGAGRGDVGRAAAVTRLGHVPGTHWSYSSGSANILSRVLRSALGGRAQYRSFLNNKLFKPLGITSAVAEFDAAGTWIGSSYIHATARDYARFGLLYLRGGVWGKERIVPQEWIDIGRTPTLPSKGQYGALFWLNALDPDTGAPAITPDLPTDTFLARGFGGQLIAIVPSRDVVMVMLNAAYTDDTSPIARLIGAILAELHKQPPGN